MLARLEQPRARIRRLTAGLTTGVDSIVERLRWLWRWANALDLPFSPLQWILFFYLVFGLVYALATPVFEANEELWHFGYIEHLRETGSLPEQDIYRRDTVFRQHGSQPPLYYALMALATAPFSLEDLEVYRRLNPHVTASQPGAFGNKNLVAHDESQARFGGAGLAVLAIRVIGLLLGAGAIVFVYKIGELLAPQRLTVAFVAAAITGLNPMFIFVTASVNNDSLAMLLNGAIVWLLLRLLRDGFSLRYTFAIALLFAFTSLTKLTGLALAPIALGVAVAAFRKTRDRGGLQTYLYVLALLWLLIAGWWFFRNAHLYGEPMGLVTMASIAGPRDPTFNLADLFAEYQQFRMSYWGLFGAQNIQLASVFYLLLDLMTLMGVVGCVFLGLQLLAISDFAYARYELAHLLTLASSLGFLWLGVLYMGSLTRASEGRMLFPLIAVVSPLLAAGFVEIVWWIVFSLRPPNLEFVRAGDAVPKELLHGAMLWQLRALALVACFAPFTVIASQYRSPQPVEAIPAGAQSLYAEFGDVALIAYERVDRRYATGDQVRLTLYWQVLRQSADDHSLVLALVDDQGREIGQYSTYPGAGSLRTSSWQAGAIYPDEYVIGISSAAYGRYPFALRVKWMDGAHSTAILATDMEGAAIEPVLLDMGAVVTARFQPANSGFNEIPADSQPLFDGTIRLESFKLDLELNEITLTWKADTAPEDSYTVFAHLLDAEGNLLSQEDKTPRLPSKYWRWGESYTTFHRFDPQYGMLDHAVSVGFYLHDGESFPRLEYTKAIEAAEEGQDSEQVFNTFTIPWDNAAEALELTATAAPPDDEADERDAESTSLATEAANDGET